MVTALLMVIYIAFIGLGLSHSLFGAALPAIQADLAFSADMVNLIPFLTSGFTVVASMLGARLVNKFGTRVVILVSAIIAASALFGFSISGNFLIMCFLAIPLGLSAGATDAALNNYIALHYSAMHFNFMHCFYGVGITASPFIMAFMLDKFNWRIGYRSVVGIQLVIIAIIVFTLPLWKKVRHKVNGEEVEPVKQVNLSYLSMIKTPEIRLDWLMCIAVNAIEGVAGTWGAFYFVNAHNLTDAAAAGLITLFYIGLALGRFFSGLLSTKISSWNLIKISSVVMILGTVVMFIPIPLVGAVGFFLIGLGNGPIYPNILHLTPRNFKEEYSGSILGSLMATAYFGFMIGPPIYGFLAERVSASVLPIYIGIWDVAFVLATIFLLRKLKEKKSLD